jgi:hypothetical protein
MPSTTGMPVVDHHEIGRVAGRPRECVERPLERQHVDLAVHRGRDLLENSATGRLVVDDHHGVLQRRNGPECGAGQGGRLPFVTEKSMG